MERSISNRFYFDYNSTSPLSERVFNFLQSGELPFGNTSSLHLEGQWAKRLITETSDYLFEAFNLSPDGFKLFFHSGATEGINSIFKGLAIEGVKRKEKWTFFFSTVDHAASFTLKEDLEILGHEVVFFDVDKNGQFNAEKLISLINHSVASGRRAGINFLFVNNETGVLWPLHLASEIKKRTGAFIHVDAVQSIGKVPKWEILDSLLDSYTYSGHKFGSLKSAGFTFLKKNSPWRPLISGGPQQEGMRAGTQAQVITYTLKLALQDIFEKCQISRLEKAHEILLNGLNNHLGRKIEIVAQNTPQKALNTLFIIFKGQNAQHLLTKLDIAGLAVSLGSACSSGLMKENRILLSMGYSSADALSGIRLSFSPYMTPELAEIYLEKLLPHL